MESSIEKVKSTVLSPSRTESSTPDTTMVCVVFQFAGVKTSVVVDKPTSAASEFATRIVTAVLGFLSRYTNIEEVTVPDSFTLIKPVGLTINPESRGSI